MNTLPAFQQKTNIRTLQRSSLDLSLLVRLGRQLSFEILVAERTDDPRLDDLLEAKNRINKALGQTLKFVNPN